MHVWRNALRASAPLAFTESPAIEIVGDYRYAYHEPETIAEAKQVACLEALRQAISTTAAVRERTASMVDCKVFHNLIHDWWRRNTPATSRSCNKAKRAGRYIAR